MFVKMFKPEDGTKLQKEKVEATPEISDEKNKKAEAIITEFIDRINSVMAS